MRFPDGQRRQRRFPREAPISAVAAFCQVSNEEAAAGRAFTLAQPFPGEPFVWCPLRTILNSPPMWSMTWDLWCVIKQAMHVSRQQCGVELWCCCVDLDLHKNVLQSLAEGSLQKAFQRLTLFDSAGAPPMDDMSMSLEDAKLANTMLVMRWRT